MPVAETVITSYPWDFMVGTPGRNSLSCSAAMPRTRNFPVLTSGTASEIPPASACTCPPSSAVTDGAPPSKWTDANFTPRCPRGSATGATASEEPGGACAGR